MLLFPNRPLTLSLLTALTALLAACGSATPQTPKPNPTPTPTEVSGRILGQITPFAAGDASSVHEGNGTPADQSGGGSLVDAGGNLLTAPVSGQGQFDLALPKVATMTGAPDASLLIKFPDVFGPCDNVQTDAPTFRVYPINELATDTGKKLTSEIDPSRAEFNYRTWWFTETTRTVTFKGNCTVYGAIDTTLALQKGWNLVIWVIDPLVSSTYSVSTQPTTPVPWRDSPSTTTAALKYPNFLTPWKNLPQYRNR